MNQHALEAARQFAVGLPDLADEPKLFRVTGYVPDGVAIDVTREFSTGSDAVAWAIGEGAIGIVARRAQE